MRYVVSRSVVFDEVTVVQRVLRMCHGNKGPDGSADAGLEPELQQLMDMNTPRVDAWAAPKPTGASRTILVSLKVDSSGSPLKAFVILMEQSEYMIHQSLRGMRTVTTFACDCTAIGWTCLLVGLTWFLIVPWSLARSTIVGDRTRTVILNIGQRLRGKKVI